ncbi:hypothetical protein CPL00172_CDS0023 [Escherichia phage BubbaBully]
MVCHLTSRIIKSYSVTPRTCYHIAKSVNPNPSRVVRPINSKCMITTIVYLRKCSVCTRSHSHKEKAYPIKWY